VHHDALRIVLKHGEQRDDIIALRARHHQFVGGYNTELSRSRADHLDGGRARASRENFDVQAVRLIRSRVEAAELRVGLPVESQPDLARRFAAIRKQHDCGRDPQKASSMHLLILPDHPLCLDVNSYRLRFTDAGLVHDRRHGNISRGCVRTSASP
jgi:hypothetical protein